MLWKDCSSSLVQFSTPTKAAKSSEVFEEFTGCALPLALLTLFPQILQCSMSCPGDTPLNSFFMIMYDFGGFFGWQKIVSSHNVL